MPRSSNPAGNVVTTKRPPYSNDALTPISPPPVITVDAELDALYNLLGCTCELLDRLEAKLHPVVFPAAPTSGPEVSAQMVPPVIERIRGMAYSVVMHNERLAGTIERLAV